jgi:hypothetical protein
VLTGVWLVDRRASDVAPRFLRLTMYPDGRFGALGSDGRTVVYGNWDVACGPPHRPRADPDASHASHALPDAEPAWARFTLRFDHHADPSAEYTIAAAPSAQGPLELTELGDHGARVVLVRAGALDGALIGAWHLVAAHPAHDARPLDALELRRDATYVLRLPGGVARSGRWSFTRTSPHGAGRPLAGALVLDPTQVVLPREYWRVAVDGARHPALLEIQLGSSAWARLARTTLEPAAHALVATWRLVGPAGAPAPQEITLRADGTLELLARPRSPRTPGRWTFVRDAPPRAPRFDALEGTLVLTVLPPGQPARRDERRVALAFARGAELHVALDDAAASLRYRRLFR